MSGCAEEDERWHKERATRAQLAHMIIGIQAYKIDSGEYPSEGVDWFEMLGEHVNANQVRVITSGGHKTVVDMWGSAIQYRRSDKGFSLLSWGPNGRSDEGGGDDISDGVIGE